ncbi:MAG: hypothetical protein IKR51_03120, partial [Oscillospiraceae bacterium]|nr:hypothetical protein [Oscillospiraceae bacterium]
DAVVDYLVEKSYSVTYGARNLRRLIQKEIEDPVANAIIENYTASNKTITVDCADGAITVACIVMMPDKTPVTT